MRFEPIKLYERVDTGKRDRLNNPIYTEVLTAEAEGRPTEWTAEDVAVYGQKVTQGTRKLLLAPKWRPYIAPRCVVELDGQRYEVVELTNLKRWFILILKGARLTHDRRYTDGSDGGGERD